MLKDSIRIRKKISVSQKGDPVYDIESNDTVLLAEVSNGVDNYIGDIVSTCKACIFVTTHDIKAEDLCIFDQNGVTYTRKIISVVESRFSNGKIVELYM